MYSYCFPQNIKESFIGERDWGVDNTHFCIFTNLCKQNFKAIWQRGFLFKSYLPHLLAKSSLHASPSPCEGNASASQPSRIQYSAEHACWDCVLSPFAVGTLFYCPLCRKIAQKSFTNHLAVCLHCLPKVRIVRTSRAATPPFLFLFLSPLIREGTTSSWRPITSN